MISRCIESFKKIVVECHLSVGAEGLIYETIIYIFWLTGCNPRICSVLHSLACENYNKKEI